MGSLNSASLQESDIMLVMKAAKGRLCAPLKVALQVQVRTIARGCEFWASSPASRRLRAPCTRFRLPQSNQYGSTAASDPIDVQIQIDPDNQVPVVHITSVDASRNALASLIGDASASTKHIAPPDDCNLYIAGKVAVDLEGPLTNPQYDVKVISVQVGLLLPMAAAKEAEPCGAAKVYYWDLKKMESATDRAAAMQHVARILTDDSVLKVLHGGRADASALYSEYGIHLGRNVADTQAIYAQWCTLVARVLTLREINSRAQLEFEGTAPPHLRRWPRIPAKYAPQALLGDRWHETFKSSAVSPGTLIADALCDMPVAAGAQSAAGLNEVYTSCGLPKNSLKDRAGLKGTAKMRYAVWDVAFLLQAHAHMIAAIRYLTDQLLAFGSSNHLYPSFSAGNCHEGTSLAPKEPCMGLDLPPNEIGEANTVGTAPGEAPTDPADEALLNELTRMMLQFGRQSAVNSAVTHCLALSDAAKRADTALSTPSRRRVVELKGLRQIAVKYPEYFEVLPKNAFGETSELFALRDANRLLLPSMCQINEEENGNRGGHNG